MKRNVINKLIQWKKTKKHKPVLLTGVKGVGKTYLAFDFSNAFFENIIYINFEHQNNIEKFFEIRDTIEIRDKLIEVNLFIPNDNKKDEINFSQSILILDEVPNKKLILEKIDLLYKKDIFPYIIMISSGSTHVDFPECLKNFKHITLHPLSFDEFLRAINYDWYIGTIKTHYENNTKIPDILHKELLQLHDLYLQIGGMPSLINEYLSLLTTINLAEQHKALVGSYYNYILENDLEAQALKMKQVLESLPQQLIKDNKKFQYKIIRKGTTYAMYRDAIKNLIDGGYILRSNKIRTEDLVSLSNKDKRDIKLKKNNSFKLYMPDVGLLYTGLIEEGAQYKDLSMRKALLENYIGQTLHSSGYPLYFWESRSMAKIEFIIKKDKTFIPIEVHASSNTRSKSISVLKQSIDFPYGIKISSRNFSFSNDIKYVPYYAAFCI